MAHLGDSTIICLPLLRAPCFDIIRSILLEANAFLSSIWSPRENILAGLAASLYLPLGGGLNYLANRQSCNNGDLFGLPSPPGPVRGHWPAYLKDYMGQEEVLALTLTCILPRSLSYYGDDDDLHPLYTSCSSLSHGQQVKRGAISWPPPDPSMFWPWSGNNPSASVLLCEEAPGGCSGLLPCSAHSRRKPLWEGQRQEEAW